MRHDGFTLIELVVTIAVISIIAVGMVVAIDPLAQLKKSRDAARKNAVLQIRKSLDSYFLLHQTYPSTGWVNSTAGPNWIPTLTDAADAKNIPLDPTNHQTGGVPWADPSNYAIYYLSDSWFDGVGGPNCGANPTNHYLITVHLENSSDPLAGNIASIGNGSPGCSYSIAGWYTVTPQSN